MHAQAKLWQSAPAAATLRVRAPSSVLRVPLPASRDQRPRRGRGREAGRLVVRADAEASGAAAWASWQRVRATGPLVQCITNFVSMDIMANTLLAAGASPAMVHCAEEVESFMNISSALLINIGTLTPPWVSSMKLAIQKGKELGKPWVLDPVGAGATPYRTQVCVELLRLGPTVVRGNGSEILALAGAEGLTKGVDSTASSQDALEEAKRLARDYQCIVAVSGEVDLITDGTDVLRVSNGVPMLTLITATGCSVTALIAAFVAAAPAEQRLHATAHALAVFGLAAEEGAKEAKGPGSLRVELLDNLYGISESAVVEGIRIEKAVAM